jgi:enoyl-CoA hydratase
MWCGDRHGDARGGATERPDEPVEHCLQGAADARLHHDHRGQHGPINLRCLEQMRHGKAQEAGDAHPQRQPELYTVPRSPTIGPTGAMLGISARHGKECIRPPMTDSDDILFGRDGGLAIVTLNRPQALNAFTLGMYRQFDPMLQQWAEDPSIQAVLVRGAEGRAFCAGGDIRAIYDAGRGIVGDPTLTSRFFREEYELLRRIHHYGKPYVAIIDGITMGGGAGVSVNGAFRVATERTMLAMPETGIGLFPDVGATRFLNRCPGHVGRYLGLAGARLGPAEALYCGFATHFVPRDQIPALVEALVREAPEGRVAAVLAAFNQDPGVPPLSARRAAIDRCFAGDTVEAILASLAEVAQAGGGDAEWAAATRAGLLTKSPTSLKVTLRQLITGARYDLEAALALEYRLTQHMMRGHDFYEGVRAALVDKDQQPRWRPASLAEVSDAMVDAYFAPLGEDELRFD